MIRLTALAAALAAGMTTFAAHAQESGVDMSQVFQAKDNGKTREDTTKDSPRAEAGRDATPDGPGALHLGKTETVKRAKTKQAPELVATARKGTTGAPEAAEAKTVVAAAKSGGRYHSIVQRYASEYGVPVSLAHAVIRIESNYNAGARGRAGEVGLMQIKPSTARGLGYSGSIKALYNPETNIRYGMKYLAKAHELGGGSTCGTILKYNAGHGAKRMNPVSAAYCSKVKRHLGGS